MRKLIVVAHVSLDGVMQAPGATGEDPSGGFTRGGWIAPYSDEALGNALRAQMNVPFDLLLGRKTYEIWAPYWPQHAEGIWPSVNSATKYVASNTHSSGEWQPTVLLNGDVAQKVSELKQQDGPDLHVYGSSNLLQTLTQQDLVDAYWLKIYPLTLGTGKRLFFESGLPSVFTVTDHTVTSKGVVIANYERLPLED